MIEENMWRRFAKLNVFHVRNIQESSVQSHLYCKTTILVLIRHSIVCSACTTYHISARVLSVLGDTPLVDALKVCRTSQPVLLDRVVGVVRVCQGLMVLVVQDLHHYKVECSLRDLAEAFPLRTERLLCFCSWRRCYCLAHACMHR